MQLGKREGYNRENNRASGKELVSCTKEILGDSVLL